MSNVFDLNDKQERINLFLFFFFWKFPRKPKLVNKSTTGNCTEISSVSIEFINENQKLRLTSNFRPKIFSNLN